MEQIEWMKKYTKSELISGLKNMACSTRIKGENKTTMEPLTVNRTEYMTGNKYEHILYQPILTIVDGTDMTKYQLVIDNVKYSWGDLTKEPVGLLKYKAFRAGLLEKNMDEIKC
tara:strand:+ start:654 stop:995 length:342 start_codon:yes stop_codon:yes gene_type:complete